MKLTLACACEHCHNLTFALAAKTRHNRSVLTWASVDSMHSVFFVFRDEQIALLSVVAAVQCQ